MKVSDHINTIPTKFRMFLGLCFLLNACPILFALFQEQPDSWYWSDINNDQKVLLLVLLFLMIIWAAIFYMTVKAEVIIIADEKEIKAQIKPLMRKFRVMPLKDIESLKIRPFSAIGNYGGIGYRRTLGKTTAYILSFKGNVLELKLKDGRKLNIEISKLEKWEEYLSILKLEKFG